MTVSKELMMSILSMDAYNHGYTGGMLGVGSQIGAASVFGQSNIAAGSFERGASFYAISHIIGSGVDGIASGTTVFSYRGTCAFWSELATLDQEISYGGSYQQDEIALALKFYKIVNPADGLGPDGASGRPR